MWLCPACNEDAEFSLVTSYGPCEKCGQNKLCMNIHKDNKKPKNNPHLDITVNEMDEMVAKRRAFLGKKSKGKLKKR